MNKKYAVIDDNGNVYGHDLDFAEAQNCLEVANESSSKLNPEIIEQ